MMDGNNSQNRESRQKNMNVLVFHSEGYLQDESLSKGQEQNGLYWGR